MRSVKSFSAALSPYVLGVLCSQLHRWPTFTQAVIKIVSKLPRLRLKGGREGSRGGGEGGRQTSCHGDITSSCAYGLFSSTFVEFTRNKELINLLRSQGRSGELYAAPTTLSVIVLVHCTCRIWMRMEKKKWAHLWSWIIRYILLPNKPHRVLRSFVLN